MAPTKWGEAIERLLSERGWTQKQLAAAASVRSGTLTNILKHGHDTDTATLTRIAVALDVDLSELFITQEQSDILRAYRKNRIARLKEAVISEVSSTVARLVREDYERILAGERHRLTTKPRRKTRKRKTSK